MENVPIIKVEIPHTLLGAMQDEASRMHPLETGGVFMGFHREGVAHVTNVIGPCPNGNHGTHSFQPDQDSQNLAIAKVYAESGRRHTYLGDWHSHPGATTGELSSIDRRTLRKIALHKEARAPNPIMCIVFGGKLDVSFQFWRLANNPKGWAFWPPSVLEVEFSST